MAVISLLAIEETLKTAGPQKRHETLHAVTDMFLSAAPALAEDAVDRYDEVLNLLASRSDDQDRVAVSRRIAPIANAPRQLVKRFAGDTNIEIAGPILTQSPRLTADDLCEIAASRGNAHLLAMSGRKDLVERVTDILVSRGDGEVARAVAENQAAKLSAQGIERLLERAEADDAIGQRMRARSDIAPEIVEAARAKLAARTAEKSHRAVAAEKTVREIQQSGGLHDACITAFATDSAYDEVVASLALLSNLKFDTVENMMHPQRIGGVVLVCKATGLVWSTVSAILRLCTARNGVSETEVKQANRDFLGLSKAAADRIIRF